MKAKIHLLATIFFLVLAQACTPAMGPDQVATGVAGTLTALPLPGSPTTQAPMTPAPPPVVTPGTSGAGAPYPDAPLCPDTGDAHDNSKFHTLWDAVRGCHYDHEHGKNPFTPEVAAAFPGFDLRALLGGVEIGHSNPSSPMENTHKHGGFKWQVDLNAPQSCALGFEDGTVAVDAYAIEYHSFGLQSVEFEARNHSSAALLRQCKPDNPADKGYIFVIQLQEFGHRVAPYQGMVLPYPDSPQPAYDSSFGPYNTSACVGSGIPGCGKLTFAQIIATNHDAVSIWTSKPTGSGTRPETSRLFRLLFRVRDDYQILDSSDLEHPFTWRYLCGDTVYDPAGCRYNNSTSTVHEIAGDIPAEWDGMAGFDTDPRPGRITAEGYVTRFGTLQSGCTAPDPATDCYPIKMVGAFVGTYSSQLSAGKVSNATPQNTPERDIYFCGKQVCSEEDPGATASGWFGPNN